MNLFRRFLNHFRNRDTAANWLKSPAGCCECGTGGPYYTGSATQATRYLYTGVCLTSSSLDWSACSAHPVRSRVPVVDYGADVVVTYRQAEADVAAVLADAQ